MPFDFGEFLKQAAAEAGEEIQENEQVSDIAALLEKANEIIEKISQDGTITLASDPVAQQAKEDETVNAEQQMEASSPATEPASEDPVDQTNEEIKEQNMEMTAEAMGGLPKPEEIDAVAEQIVQNLKDDQKSAALFEWASKHVYDLIEDYFKMATIIDKVGEEYRQPLEKIATLDVMLLGYAAMGKILKDVVSNEKAAAFFEDYMPFTFRYLMGDK